MALLLLFGLLGLGVSQYTPHWDSLDSRPFPRWYTEARFGIKIHWGPYAVPGFGALGTYAEQYERFYRVGTADCGSPQNPTREGCETAAFHQRVYGERTYDDIATKDFRPHLYDATSWADVFRRGGAQYVYMTAKHSDGFAMWPSPRRPDFNSQDILGRDLLGELMEALRGAGLRNGIFYEFEDYFRFGCRYKINASGSPLHEVRCPWGGSDEGFPAGTAARYVNEMLHAELRDLVQRYGPDYLYVDGDWSGSDEFLRTKEFLTWLFNESPVKEHVVVNDRWGNTTRTHHGGTYMCEYDPECVFDHPFAVTQGFGKSFGYNRNEEMHPDRWCDWLQRDGGRPSSGGPCTGTNATGLVHLLVRTVAKSGNLELNFGPEGDGTLSPSMVVPLLGLGRWLEVNGEAIYNTSGFPFGRHLGECTGDAKDAGLAKCYTFREDGGLATVYVMYFRFPQLRSDDGPNRTVRLDHVEPTSGTTVRMLSRPEPLEHRNKADGGMQISVPVWGPDELRCEQDLCHAFTFKITNAKLLKKHRGMELLV